MALKGQTAYYTARQCNGNRNYWKVYRVVKETPEHPTVQWLEEPVSKPVLRDRAMQLVGELMVGITSVRIIADSLEGPR